MPPGSARLLGPFTPRAAEASALERPDSLTGGADIYCASRSRTCRFPPDSSVRMRCSGSELLAARDDFRTPSQVYGRSGNASAWTIAAASAAPCLACIAHSRA
jgi:hypothetical protein